MDFKDEILWYRKEQRKLRWRARKLRIENEADIELFLELETGGYIITTPYAINLKRMTATGISNTTNRYMENAKLKEAEKDG
jgi:hypothetical protein